MISVIIPVYNGEGTIKETIESVLNQTFSDLEIIIINDGSTDSTLEILSTIDDSRIKVFSYPNAGPSASRNRGIDNSQGEYISFIDADDLWTPDKLESQLQALKSNPQAVVAYSWTDYIDERSQFLRKGLHPKFKGNVYEELLKGNFLENGSNPLIQKDAFREVGNFDESLKCIGVEDWDMYLRLAAEYQFICIPSPQILYRVSSNSTSTKIDKMEKAGLYVIQKNFAQAPPSFQHHKKETLTNIYIYLALKSVEGIPSFQKSQTGLKYLGYLLKHDPSLIRKRQRLASILVFKVLVGLFLPSRQAQRLLDFVKKRQGK